MAKFMLAILLVSFVSSIKLPGVLLGFTPTLLNSILKDILPMLETELKDFVFPPIEFNTPLANVIIQEFSIETVQLMTNEAGFKFKETREIVLDIPGIELQLNFAWVIKTHGKGVVMQEGTSKVIVTDASIGVSVVLTEDLKKLVKLEKCSFEIAKFQVLVDNNSAKGIVNWIMDAMSKKIKRSLEKEVSGLLNYTISAVIGNIPRMDEDLLMQFSSWLTLNTRFVSTPKIDPSHIEIEIDGTFMKIDSTYKIDVPVPTTLKFQNADSFAIHISEYTLNTLSLSKFQDDPMQLSSNDFGSDFPTEFIFNLFPQITEEFGKHQRELICKQNTNSLFKLKDKLIANIINLTCAFNVKEKSILEFLVDVYTETEIKLGFGLIRGSISKLELIKVELTENHLSEDLNMENFNAQLNILCLSARVYFSNRIFKTGILLPDYIDDHFDSLKLRINQESISIEGNLKPLTSNP